MQQLPDATGHFGQFGGRYVPETLMPALLELEDAYNALKDNTDFQEEFRYYLREYVGRPNPLYYAERLTENPRWCEDIPQTGRSQPYRRT